MRYHSAPEGKVRGPSFGSIFDAALSLDDPYFRRWRLPTLYEVGSAENSYFAPKFAEALDSLFCLFSCSILWKFEITS